MEKSGFTGHFALILVSHLWQRALSRHEAGWLLSPVPQTAAEKGGKQMTLLELSREYRQQEARLRTRILELRQQKKTCPPEELFRLNRRIMELSELRRETREIATLLEHYYERGYQKRGKYAL